MPMEIASASGLDVLLGRPTAPNTVRLFKNNYTPVATSVASDFTEANFSGYTAQSVTYGARTTTGTVCEKFTDAVEFVHNGGGTANDIYGWYSNSGGDEIFAARFSAAPITMNSLGDRLSLALNLECYEDGDEVASDFIVNNTAENAFVTSICSNNGFTVHLFKSDTTPGDSDTASTYTAATFSGYTSKTVPFAAAAATVGTRGERQSNLLSWTCTSAPGSPETIYGYYLTTTVGSVFIGAQRFASPITITLVGDHVEFYLVGAVESVN